jgi:4,5-DOPA dioxygenase extradiol
LALLQFDGAAPAPAWAQSFNGAVRVAVQDHRHADLANYEALDAGAPMSVPTPEHYLPLLYVLALQRAGESASMPVDGIELGAISMMCVQVGG